MLIGAWIFRKIYLVERSPASDGSLFKPCLILDIFAHVFNSLHRADPNGMPKLAKVQVATDWLKDSSSHGLIGPVLQAFYRFLVVPQSAQLVESSLDTIFFVDVGRFKMDEREKYIVFLIPVTPLISYWFSGRPRFTASLIELLVTQPGGHRTAFSVLLLSA